MYVGTLHIYNLKSIIWKNIRYLYIVTNEDGLLSLVVGLVTAASLYQVIKIWYHGDMKYFYYI